MNIDLIISNFTNPAFLFFILGIVAVRIKSDLEIPENSSKFISLYLLFSIGFKGGQELAQESLSLEVFWSILLAIFLAVSIPIYTFFILKRKFSIQDSGAIAATYGSVSAVTFVTAVSYLENLNLPFHGYMVAIMALMESPSIIAGLVLIAYYTKQKETLISKSALVKHSFTNGSVLLILGSLVIGFLADSHQAEGIKPFTNDIFKGFLAIFLLDMGIVSGRKLNDFIKYGWTPIIFAILIPLFNGICGAFLSSLFIHDIATNFMFAVLAASASYIAVPAAMKLAAPKSNPGLYLPMALAITFPFNIILGFPIYLNFVYFLQ